MSYEPMPPGARGFLPIYISILIISLIMTIKMFYKWKERKTNSVKYMFLVFILLTFSTIALIIGFMEMYITGEKRELYRLTLPISYFSLTFSILPQIRFISELFPEEIKYKKALIVIALIIAVLVILPWNYYGIPTEEIGDFNIRTYSNVIMLIFLIYIFSKSSRLFLLNAKIQEDPIAKKGFSWLAYSQISFVIFILFIALDAVYFTITGTVGYSVFLYIAWVFAGFFYIYSYLGLIMPKWAKERALREKNK
ncbi:MAG: hypothetical protein ACTSVC_06425 [Promethearchaeota archaeon]